MPKLSNSWKLAAMILEPRISSGPNTASLNVRLGDAVAPRAGKLEGREYINYVVARLP